VRFTRGFTRGRFSCKYLTGEPSPCRVNNGMENEFGIRNATPEDMDNIMSIYAHAREFMIAHGNPHQWAERSWPPEELIREDIATRKSYVCERADKVVGVFYYEYGNEDPTYVNIEDGAWKSDAPYGVVHRIASDGSVSGIGSYCINWAYEQCGHIRIDTHGDNTVMQSLLKKLGFEYCGIIHVQEDNYPRIAYEKVDRGS